MRKVANKQKKQDAQSRMKNKKPISVCFIIPYICKKHETWFTFIGNCCKQIWGLERAAILWSAPGDI